MFDGEGIRLFSKSILSRDWRFWRSKFDFFNLAFTCGHPFDLWEDIFVCLERLVFRSTFLTSRLFIKKTTLLFKIIITLRAFVLDSISGGINQISNFFPGTVDICFLN
jgi:hypothetical protein